MSTLLCQCWKLRGSSRGQRSPDVSGSAAHERFRAQMVILQMMLTTTTALENSSPDWMKAWSRMLIPFGRLVPRRTSPSCTRRR